MIHKLKHLLKKLLQRKQNNHEEDRIIDESVILRAHQARMVKFTERYGKYDPYDFTRIIGNSHFSEDM